MRWWCPAARLHLPVVRRSRLSVRGQSAVQGLGAADARPDSWLVYTPGQRPKVIYLQPFDYWHVVPSAPSRLLGRALRHRRHPQSRTRRCSTCRRTPRAARSSASRKARSATYVPNNPRAVLDYLHYHRAYKTPYEIAMMRAASRIGARAHRAAERAFRAGAASSASTSRISQAAGQDANELPYGNIVALNEHGAVLHYTDLRPHAAASRVRSFLIDAGASHDGYACDITRTYSQDTGGRIPGADRRGRSRAAGACAPRCATASTIRQLHLDAHLSLARILREFGLIRVSPEVAVETGVTLGVLPARHRARHRPAGARRGRLRRKRQRRHDCRSPTAIRTCA